MALGHRNVVLRHLRRAATLADGGGCTDGELLGAFVARRDEESFRALVRRHGPMVFGVCRRVLGHEHDAEDAFQATFLVLAKRAGAVAPPERVGNWLYGVAYRTALKARSLNRLRQVKEWHAGELIRPGSADEAGRDLRELLDRELNRLPDKYRVPVVLCELEGLPLKEVARQLGWPPGTVASRLARARGLLAVRLARHGLAAAGGVLTALAAGSACAAVPAPLAMSTVQSAVNPAAAAPRVAALTEGVIRGMSYSKFTLVSIVLMTLVLIGTAAGALRPPDPSPPPARVAIAAAAPAQPDDPPEKKAIDQFYALYALPDGEVLKRVPTPFPPSRMVYYRTKNRDQARAIPAGPTAMYFRWQDNRLDHWGMCFGSDNGNSLGSVIDMLTHLPPQVLEGDAELRQARITGDFIVREGAPVEKVIARLEEILQKECKEPIKLTFKDVERKVTVAKGKFKLTPLPNQAVNTVQIFARKLAEDSGAGGGSGNVAEFLKAVGWFIDRRIVSDVENEAPAKFIWYYHRRSPATAEQQREDTDPVSVLNNVTIQTGLEFKEETRKVRVLFVERAPEVKAKPDGK